MLATTYCFSKEIIKAAVKRRTHLCSYLNLGSYLNLCGTQRTCSSKIHSSLPPLLHFFFFRSRLTKTH